MNYEYGKALDIHLPQILELQRANLKANLTEEEKSKEGFITVPHLLEELKTMNDKYPHTIATYNGELIGYALSMGPEFRNLMPILVPMFEMIDVEMSNQNRNDSFMIMGQVCIAKGHRGKGVFSGLYHYMRDSFSNKFNVNITEVAVENFRSMRAHEKVGYDIMKVFTDKFGVQWALVEWKW